MKTQLNVKTSRNAIKFVTGIVDKRSNLPILSNVHCYANGHFEMTATDLDVTLRAVCPAQSTLDGRTTIPARALLDVATIKNGDANVELSADAKHVATFLTGGNSRTACGLGHDEFPQLPPMPGNHPQAVNGRTYSFDAAQFIAALKSVEVAQSTDASRYILNGVCVQIGAEDIRLIATNGRSLHVATLPGGNLDTATMSNIEAARSHLASMECALELAKGILAEVAKTFPPVFEPVKGTTYFREVASVQYREAQLPVETAQEKATDAKNSLALLVKANEFVLPSNAVKHILRIPLDKTAPATVCLTHWTVKSADPKSIDSTDYARIVCGDYSIITNLVAGNYPNYRQVIPGESIEQVRVNVAEFKSTIEAGKKSCSEKSNSVKLAFSQNLLTVSSNSPEIGECRAGLGINYAGKDFSIAFDPKYLLDACTAFAVQGDVMTMEFIDALSPVKIVNTSGLLAVIMPMRLS